jgi:hypothetical protein
VRVRIWGSPGVQSRPCAVLASDPVELERRLRERLDALTPAARAELLIDCEEDRTLRAVLVGMLRESERPDPPSQG